MPLTFNPGSTGLTFHPPATGGGISGGGLLGGGGSSKGGGFNWASLGMTVGLNILSGLLGGTQVIHGPRLADRSIQLADAGSPIPKIYGTHRTAGTLVWTPPTGLVEKARSTTSGGGLLSYFGLGAPKTRTIKYEYFFTGAILISKVPWNTPITRIRRISYNAEPIYFNDGIVENGYGVDVTVEDEDLSPLEEWRQNRSGVITPTETPMTYNPTTGTRSSSRLRLYNGSRLQLPDELLIEAFGEGKATAWRDYVVAVFDEFPMTPPLGQFEFDIESGISALGAVVQDIYSDCGIPANLVDVSQLIGEVVDGFIVDGRNSGAEYIEQLGSLFHFDMVHIDGIEVAVKRGGNIVVSIPSDDMRAVEVKSDNKANTSSMPNTEWKATDPFKLPYREELQYHDINREYKPGMRAAWREAPPYVRQDNKIAVSYPGVLSGPVAQRAVDIDLFLRWQDAENYLISLGTKYRYLTPADPIGIEVAGETIRVRLAEAQRDFYRQLRWQAKPDDEDLYKAPLGEDIEGIDPPLSATAGALYYLFVDCNAFDDGDNEFAGIYCFFTVPFGTTYRLGDLDVIAEDRTRGANFKDESWANDPRQGTIGFSYDALENFTNIDWADGALVWDDENTLTVDIVGGRTLLPCTQAQALSGANKCILGREIIHFTGCTYVGEVDFGEYTRKRYELSGLLRGSRGSESFMNGHVVNEPFAMIVYEDMTLASYGKLQVPDSMIGLAVTFKLWEPAGAGTGVAIEVTSDIDGNALKPYAPYAIVPDLEFGTDGRNIDGDVKVKWDNRTRYADAAEAWWWTNVVPGIGEASEGYEAEILNESNSVVRTISNLTSRSFTYLGTQQTADFGSLQNPARVRLYPVSNRVGRGHPSDIVEV